jgi:hypothetical protein
MLCTYEVIHILKAIRQGVAVTFSEARTGHDIKWPVVDARTKRHANLQQVRVLEASGKRTWLKVVDGDVFELPGFVVKPRIEVCTPYNCLEAK